MVVVGWSESGESRWYGLKVGQGVDMGEDGGGMMVVIRRGY